jgi:mRNA-degrading endonuclease RelE of RelBE toxin-antitoxin system
MEFEMLPEYEKDFKRLRKKYRTLDSDLEVVRQVLVIRPHASPPQSVRIEGLGITDCVIKMRRIASDSLKGRGSNSGLRLIYAHYEQEERIVLIELYHKNEKESEDRERILRYFR